jgi:MFS family permease
VRGFVGAMLIRNRYLAAERADSNPSAQTEPSFTLAQALASPSFWTFSVAISFLGLVLAGTSLFGESIMHERGLDASVLPDYGVLEKVFVKKVFVNVAIVGIPFGLAANLMAGLLATRLGLWRLMALSTALFGAALLAFPLVSTESEVYTYAGVIAAAGGGMIVSFYTFYRRAFGPAHLGSIQGAAQMLTVLFSAIGPAIFASTKTRAGAYEPLFFIFAAIALGLAILTWVVGMPARPAAVPTPNKDNGENREAFTRPDDRVR